MDIRPATPTDRESLVEMLGVQLREHGVALPSADLTEAVDGLLLRPQLGRFLVASERGRIVGFAALSFLWTLEHAGRAAWLDELYVLPDRRGRGIGRALLEAAYELATSIGARALDLEIERGHERVAQLYEREGFRALSRQRWARPLPARRSPAGKPDPAAAEWLGGCLCGRIRYRISATIRDVAHCHCSLCRKSAGSPFVTWATVPAEKFSFVIGQPAEHASSAKAIRSFCGTCGTALTFREPARPDRIDVTVGSFDRPEEIEPGSHIHVSSQLPWAQIDDSLPRHPESSPR
jgi:GNAT superfamily N-acetyltransferase